MVVKEKWIKVLKIDDHIYVNSHKIDKKGIHDQSTNFEFSQSTNTSVDARKYVYNNTCVI